MIFPLKPPFIRGCPMLITYNSRLVDDWVDGRYFELVDGVMEGK
jgi:hypothetical protein